MVMPKDIQQSKVREALLGYLVAESGAQRATVTLSSKNQITLPVAMVRRLGLKPGRRLWVRLVDDRIVLRPEPEDWVAYFRGSMKGVYGKTREEMDAYVRRERQSWERRAKEIGY
jgi:antitoxin ChpS